MVAAHSVEQTEAHGLIEHLMILTNERVADACERRGCRPSTASTSAPTRARIAVLFEQLAALDLPTPPLPDPETSPRARPASWLREASRLVAREAERRGHGRERVYIACAPLAEAGLLQRSQPRPRGPR